MPVPPYPYSYNSRVYSDIDFYVERNFDMNVYNLFHCYRTLRNICVFSKVNNRATTEQLSFLQASSDKSYASLKFMSEGLDRTILLVPIFEVCYPVTYAQEILSNI